MIAPVLVLMGPSGSGKSALGNAMAERLGVPFLEGDDFHPEKNREKMRNGQALDDNDRWPWLDRLSSAVMQAAKEKGAAICSCSALKRVYRDYLRARLGPSVKFLVLVVDRHTLAERMAKRRDHYMPVSLLDSQLAAFEMPQADEDIQILDGAQPLDALVERGCALFRAQMSGASSPARPSST